MGMSRRRRRGVGASKNRYAVGGTADPTGSTQATCFHLQPIGGGAASNHVRIYGMTWGTTDTPDDAVHRIDLYDTITAAVGGSAATPAPLDPAAAASAWELVVDPTSTVSGTNYKMHFSKSRREVFHWEAAPGGEIRTWFSRGINFNISGTTTINHELTISFYE